MILKLLNKLGIKVETVSAEEAARELLKKEVTLEFHPEIVYCDDRDRSDRAHRFVPSHWLPQQHIH